jgi:hypothetical protein
MPVTKSATEPGGRLASYVDRIVRGKKPADLPVQGPARYGLAINFKAAKALGLEVAPTLLARSPGALIGRGSKAKRTCRGHRHSGAISTQRDD